MDAVDCFAVEARLFQKWALDGADQAACAVRAALIRIVRLYLAALDLPASWNDELANQQLERVTDEERHAVATACSSRLPFDLYGQVYDPFEETLGDPLGGSLSDDLCDIYLDVVTGLRGYETVQRARAAWEWGFAFEHHWGKHATGAIRALHCWLAANASEQLSASSQA